MADLTKLTSVFIKIRDARAKLSAEFKTADAKLEADMKTVKGALLAYCKEQGVDSVRTPAGIFYRSTKVRYWTSDWEAMGAFVVQKQVPEFFEKRLNQGVIKEYLENHPDDQPPGLVADSEYTITVRKA